jgi:hypothetical protein
VGRAAHQTASKGYDWPKLRETKGTQQVEEEWRQRADDQGSAMPKIFGRTREKFEETSFDWPKERKRCEETDWDWKKRELVT